MTKSDVRTRSSSSCKEWKRAVCSSDAVRWRIGRKTSHRTNRPIGGGIAGEKRPEKVTEVILVYRWVLSGRWSHGVTARTSIGIHLPWLLERRLLSEAEGNQCADYLPS